jgi:hypothetical protein
MENIKEKLVDYNEITINRVENIFNTKKGEFITVDEYNIIKEIIRMNTDDLFFEEPENLPKDLLDVLEDAEMYYGFTENEIKPFLESVNALGYTFNYVDMATRDNGDMCHTVNPYALRKINL